MEDGICCVHRQYMYTLFIGLLEIKHVYFQVQSILVSMVHIGRGILRLTCLTYAGRLACPWLRQPPRLRHAATTVMVNSQMMLLIAETLASVRAPMYILLSILGKEQSFVDRFNSNARSLFMSSVLI